METNCIQLADIDRGVSCADFDNLAGVVKRIEYGYWDDVESWPSLPEGTSGSPLTLAAAGKWVGDLVLKSGATAHTLEFTDGTGVLTMTDQGERGGESVLYQLDLVRSKMTDVILGFLNATRGRKMYFVVTDKNGVKYLLGDRLNAARGVIDLPQAQRLIQRMDKEAKDTAWLCDDEAYEKLGYRAVVSAWLRAMVLYIAEGKWSKDIENFAMWTMKYDMWCKMHFFNELMHQQMAGEVVRTRGPKNMLDQLHDTFTFEDAQTQRTRERKKNTNPTQMLCMWELRGYITRDENGVYHKTPAYLKRKHVA